MRFNAPKKMTWWIAFVLLAVGGVFWILGVLGVVALPYNIEVWCLFVSAILYALGTTVKGF